MSITIAANTSIAYGSKEICRSIDNISLPIGISLLVGRNGEGKTTFLRYLCNTLPGQKKLVHTSVYLPEELDWPPYMTPSSIAHCVLGNNCSFNHFARLLELNTNKSYYLLSKGNKQKIRALISICLANKQSSDLLLLDEPMSGLDFAARSSLWDIITEVAKERSVVISSHPEPINSTPQQVLGIKNGCLWKLNTTSFDWNKILKELSE